MIHPDLQVVGNSVARNTYQRPLTNRVKARAMGGMFKVRYECNGQIVTETYGKASQAQARGYVLARTLNRVWVEMPNGVVCDKTNNMIK